MKYDIFLSHASEDTDDIVRPLAKELERLSVRAWVDIDRIKGGCSLRESIDSGLLEARFGVVIVSPNFFRKWWSIREFDALFSSKKKIIPVWHNVNPEQVETFSPFLANIYGISTSMGIEKVAQEIVRSISEEREIPVGYGHVLSVGGSNGEYVLKLSSELRLDQKHFVESISLFGGSGVNYTLRLANMGIPVIPIPLIGADDLGRDIRKEMYEALAYKTHISNSALEFIRSDKFFVPKAKTQRTTILVSGPTRTILSEKPEGTGDFLEHLNYRLQELESDASVSIEVVIIGHIYADNKDARPSYLGACTKHIIERFSEKAFVYANFGKSQLELGYEFFEEYLPKLTVLQLNLNEIKSFFAKQGKDKTLIEIVDWLNNKKINTVITLDKLGAVCTYGDGRKGLILALPFKLKNIVDTTGAGDAFGAAIVAKLYEKSMVKNAKSLGFSFGEMLEAIEQARFWAAYACGFPGGSSNCPTEIELETFIQQIEKDVPLVEVTDTHSARTVLYLLDRAYSHYTAPVTPILP